MPSRVVPICLGLVLATTVAAIERPPNIIVILADDLGYADLGFQGCKEIPTPHLDRLARAGVRCTDGYVSHSFCSPTRAGLLTGRYQQRFGHENNPAWLPDDPKVGLPVEQTTIADVLRTAGYATGAVGKWHLGAAPCFHPNRRGFAEYFGLRGGGHHYFEHNLFKTDSPKAKQEYYIPLVRNSEPVEEHEYLTDALGREAAAFVERHRDQPFFLYLAFNAPHTPLQAPPKYLERAAGITIEPRRTYAAMVLGMDDAVGRLLTRLRDLGLDKNSLIFFFSDNGGPVTLGSPNGSQNTPLRGGKGQLYEGGIRVPFVVSWPARLPQGTEYSEPVSSLDVFASAVAAADIKDSPTRALDGTDILGHLAGKKKGSPHGTLYWRMGGGANWAIRQGSYKLVKHGKAAPELYDLRADRSETADLAAQQPETVAKLQTAYDAWNRQLQPPLFENPRPAAKAKNQKAEVRK